MEAGIIEAEYSQQRCSQVEQRLDFMCWESFPVEVQREEWRKGGVSYPLADMWHRVARLATPGRREMRIGLPNRLYQPLTRLWVRDGYSIKHTGCLGSTAVRSAGAGTGLALSTTSALPAPQHLHGEKHPGSCLIYEQKEGWTYVRQKYLQLSKTCRLTSPLEESRPGL